MAWLLFHEPVGSFLKQFPLILLMVLITIPGHAQRRESSHDTVSAINVLFYTRFIQQAGGINRYDCNIVSNFRLSSLLRMELGFRHGESGGEFGAYLGYKVELQTKNFFNRVRLLTRVSDRIVRYPSPLYSNSNYLIIAEGRIPIGEYFYFLAAAGYVWTFTRENELEGWPSSSGTTDSYPTYKFGIRYKFKKGFLDASYGAYDVFNPYLISSPFSQVTLDYDLSRQWAIYTYFRYQFYQSMATPLNYFATMGIRVKF